MIITNVLVAGSVAYAGIKTAVVKIKRKPTFSFLSTLSRPAANGAAVLGEPVGVLSLAERRHRAVAATSFWLAMGGLVFPPLTLASIPLTVYSSVPILEDGCRSIYEEGRLRPSVINSILIVSTLLTNHYLSAATFTWLHHTFRQLSRQLQDVSGQITTDFVKELDSLLQQAVGGAPRLVWVVNDNIEVKMPFAQIKVGDVLVVNQGEFIPVDGVIAAGEATVNLLLRTGNATPLTVREGDPVYTTTLVTAGRVRVKVEQILRRATA